MSLYFVKHKHSPESCPAKDPLQGNMLLEHINPINAQKFGVNLKSDAVLDNQHTFILIMEAHDSNQVEKFMAPFKAAGEVEVWPASNCEIVVERQGC